MPLRLLLRRGRCRLGKHGSPLVPTGSKQGRLLVLEGQPQMLNLRRSQKERMNWAAQREAELRTSTPSSSNTCARISWRVSSFFSRCAPRARGPVDSSSAFSAAAPTCQLKQHEPLLWGRFDIADGVWCSVSLGNGTQSTPNGLRLFLHFLGPSSQMRWGSGKPCKF